MYLKGGDQFRVIQFATVSLDQNMITIRRPNHRVGKWPRPRSPRRRVTIALKNRIKLPVFPVGKIRHFEYSEIFPKYVSRK